MCIHNRNMIYNFQISSTYPWQNVIIHKNDDENLTNNEYKDCVLTLISSYDEISLVANQRYIFDRLSVNPTMYIFEFN